MAYAAFFPSCKHPNIVTGPRALIEAFLADATDVRCAAPACEEVGYEDATEVVSSLPRGAYYITDLSELNSFTPIPRTTLHSSHPNWARVSAETSGEDDELLVLDMDGARVSLTEEEAGALLHIIGKWLGNR